MSVSHPRLFTVLRQTRIYLDILVAVLDFWLLSADPSNELNLI
jgi:hypothetical protein